ncbi:UNVERIFIED_CONTAM: hypothetical protein K2H54_057056 [Gekko kuhli]
MLVLWQATQPHTIAKYNDFKNIYVKVIYKQFLQNSVVQFLPFLMCMHSLNKGVRVWKVKIRQEKKPLSTVFTNPLNHSNFCLKHNTAFKKKSISATHSIFGPGLQ